MTFEELEEALQEILGGGYQIDKDNHGQIIIYTGLCEEDDGGELVEFESDDDEDEDFDPDFEPLEEEDDDD
jgi:hypothetical protein